ncbi:hypothetical protein ACJ73_03042 [Blastomyces percursus]|uniref:Uncharacterized protein n=1 Tax=Blastomyces percursus TaxID=1658174 RepID=A0A1J9QAM2_9EURO|nr:hypothetical protein ACJ73_03042 [Blastomyces percursus]
MDDDIGNFVVVFRPPGDAPMYKVEVNTSQYTFVAAAAALATKVLQTPQAINAMIELALELAETVAMRKPIQDNPALARQAVQLFVDKISAKFSGIVIDSSINTVQMLGFHVGIVWHGGLEDFDPRKHMIHINAQMAAADAGTPMADKHFQTFIFQLANTFVHEVGGHLLMTFLSDLIVDENGQVARPFTPPSVSYSNYAACDNCMAGESGRALEDILFGGSLEYYHDPSGGPRQPGIPYLLDEDSLVRCIPEAFISNFLANQFQFPYPVEGPAFVPRTMIPLGNTTTPIQFSHPSARPQLALQDLPNMAGDRVLIRRLRQALTDRKLRAIAV